MKSLPIHLDRLTKALQVQGVALKRHQILEVCAAAFGYHNSNECTAAAKRGELNPPGAYPVGRITMDDGRVLVAMHAPAANATYGVEESFLEQADRDRALQFGTSPYGHLLDVTSAMTEPLVDLAARLDAGRCIELTIYSATISHKHGENTSHALSEEGRRTYIEAFCVQWWKEVEHLYPNENFEGQELIDAYFEGHDQDFLECSETTIQIPAADLLSALGKAPMRERSQTSQAPKATKPEDVDPWSDHPIYSGEDWRAEVANGDTRRGYAEWVSAKIEEAGETEFPPIQPWSQDYPDGHEGVLCLTNGCCEAANGGPELFSRHGLKWSVDEGGMFYPLTDDEARFIAEDGITLPNGLYAELAYSFFYQGVKYASGTFEVAFDANSAANRDKVLAEVRAYASHIEKAVKALDGHVFIIEDDIQGDRHTIHALIPFDHVLKMAVDFSDWKIQIARILMPADGPRVIAHFQPQAWVNNYTMDVDASGETEWDITAEVIAMDPKRAQEIEDDSNESDAFTGSKAAPAFVRDWSGPYHVSVADQIAEYFAALHTR